jgi:hypothetical protein
LKQDKQRLTALNSAYNYFFPPAGDPADPAYGASKLSTQKGTSVKIKIDDSLHEKLESLANSRGIEVDTIVSIQLRAYVNVCERGRTLGPNDPMPYGQYREIKVGDVIRVNPRYINYLLANSETFKLNEEALGLLDEIDHLPPHSGD